VVLVVAKPVVGEPLEVGRLDRAAKGAGGAKANIIGQDQQNVGRSGWRLNALGKVRCRIL
jgi:hypothetical protein